MKSLFKIVSFFIVTSLLLFACGGSDNNTITQTNSAPFTFAVAVSNTTDNSATITWVAATDPDGDNVSYTVTLGDSEEASNISVLTHSFSGLSASTDYSGTVTASDGNEGTTSSTFSFTTKPQTPATLHNAFEDFDTNNVTVILNGTQVTIESNGMPNHTSPYWSNTTTRSGTPAASENHPLFVEPTATSYENMAPGNIDDFNGSYTLTVSATPTKASSTTSTGLGAIGIAVSGAMIYNDEEGPNVPLDNAIGSLDYNGAHTGPQSYHYHLEPIAFSDDDDALIAIISDGFFLYGRKCNSTGSYPIDLDASGGHTSTTQHTTTAEYHYHIQNELYLNAYYILFPDDYQGTPSTIQ